MLADEIKAGESTNIEFKVEVPKKSEKYIKSVIAFANTAGGKIVIGVDDETHEIVGVDKNEVFKIMDGITNTISDMCYPQIFAKIQCALFKGTERVVFIDKRDFEGPLYEQIEEAYEFVLKHINLGAEISGLVRTDAYELPTEAIREAIVNATTHRNFLDRACVQVAVYDDRVEVTSPGMLYGGLTIEQIKEGGSKIRNRCIAEVFSRMKIIESWGTGIKRMFSSCKEYGIREPELLEIGDSFRVNLYRPSYNALHQSVPKSEPESIPETAPKSVLKNLNKTQQKIIGIILKNPKVTQAEIAEQLNISTSAVKKSMKEIVNVGILARIGANKGGYWEVRDK